VTLWLQVLGQARILFAQQAEWQNQHLTLTAEGNTCFVNGIPSHNVQNARELVIATSECLQAFSMLYLPANVSTAGQRRQKVSLPVSWC